MPSAIARRLSLTDTREGVHVIRLDGSASDGDAETSATSMAALRLITGMDAEEFAAVLGQELGWPVPLFVYLGWEREGGKPAPADLLEAARKVALSNPIGARKPSMDRRHFFGSVVGFSALVAAGFPAGARALGGMLSVANAGGSWRASPETAADLETLVASYRRAYAGSSAVSELLPGTIGLMHLLMDLGRRDQWPGDSAQLDTHPGEALRGRGSSPEVAPAFGPAARQTPQHDVSRPRDVAGKARGGRRVVRLRVAGPVAGHLDLPS